MPPVDQIPLSERIDVGFSFSSPLRIRSIQCVPESFRLSPGVSRTKARPPALREATEAAPPAPTMNIRDGETVVQPETTILNEPISDDIVVLVRLTDRERQGRLSAHLSSANRALKDEFVHAQVEEDDPGNLGLTRFQFRRENVRFEKPGVVILTIEIISSQPHGSESLRVFQTRIHVNENTAAANEARTNGVGPNNSRIFEERHSNEALPEENTHERD